MAKQKLEKSFGKQNQKRVSDYAPRVHPIRIASMCFCGSGRFMPSAFRFYLFLELKRISLDSSDYHSDYLNAYFS